MWRGEVGWGKETQNMFISTSRSTIVLPLIEEDLKPLPKSERECAEPHRELRVERTAASTMHRDIRVEAHKDVRPKRT